VKSTIVLHPDMGPAILKHLQQFGKLPSTGILAGQAVDSAITDLFGKGGGVYNDLDIFRNAPNTGRIGAAHFASSLTSRSQLELRLAEQQRVADYEGMSAIVTLARLYRIKSVSRDDMLNFVQCTMADGHMSRRLQALDVIAGFDLNCTRVAIDLATKKLVWDHHYEQFLQSRQLRIAMMHTPWHTFLRLAKKSQELPNVYADFEAAAQACTSVAQSPLIRGLREQDAVSTLFGSKHLEQAEATRSIWTPYFRLQAIPLARTGPRHWAPAAGLEPGAVISNAVTLHALEPRGALDANLQSRCDNLGIGIVFFASTLVDESRRTVGPSTVKKLEAIQECRPRLKPSDALRLDFVRYCADALGTSYVAGQALPAVANKVAAWLDKHGLLKEKFFGLTLAQQNERMQTIVQLAREYGAMHYDGDSEHVIGVLELTATTNDLQSRDAMLALLDSDRAQAMTPFSGAPLKLPARLPALFADFTVTEMRRPFDLAREGREMHHCVGGYSQAVQRGGSRILSVKFKNHRTSPFCSTVELKARFKKNGTLGGRLEIAQNRTHSNKRPSDENQAFVEFLCDYLKLADGKAAPEQSAKIAAEATAIEATLRNETYANGESVRQLEKQLRAARTASRHLTKKLDEAARKAALYTLLAETQASLPAPSAASGAYSDVGALALEVDACP
jgi:hypothetical protein